MSNTIHSFAVVLAEDIGEEKAERVRNALLQLKGVISVSPNVTDFTSIMAEDRARSDMFKRLVKVLEDWNKN